MDRESDFPPRAWRAAALVIVGHGSGRNVDSQRPTLAHAEALRRRGLFAEVRTAFLKEPPRLTDVLADIRASVVYVVPNLAYAGYTATAVVPREGSLSGRITERDGHRILLCDAVGTHPLIARTMASRITSVMTANRLPPTDTCVLLVAHGSTRSGESARQSEILGERLATLGVAAEIRTVFLEQEPRVNHWTKVTAAPNVVVSPYLMADGQHGAEDVPAMLGLDGAGPGTRRDAGGRSVAGPFAAAGRRLWLCPAAGGEPVVAEAILERVAEVDAAYGGSAGPTPLPRS